MKKSALLLVVLAVCCLLGGCQLWMDGSYHSVTPYIPEGNLQVKDNAEAKTYLELRDVMQGLVETGTQSGVIFVDSISAENVEAYMEMAIRYITQIHAIGSYSVDEINYTLGTNSGKQALAVNIRYLHSKAEILRLQEVSDMDGAIEMIAQSLTDIDSSVVVLVHNYENRDIPQIVQNLADQNPEFCMEIPQVTVTTYPVSGSERVLQVNFSYQTDRDVLRNMQEMVKPVFSSAELYVRGDGEMWEKYAQLYSFLMERYDYTIETSITPAYSLLHHGVGDSKAFAVVYSYMCRKAGLDCSVVSGTKSGEPRYWNVILYDGEYYYVDLLSCSRSGGFFTRTFHQMTGYVWDYSAYGQDSPPSGTQWTESLTANDPSTPAEDLEENEDSEKENTP